MNRRWWMRSALGFAVIGGLAAGTGWWHWRPGFQAGAWPADVSPTLKAVAQAILQGSLPVGMAARHIAVQAWTQRLQATLAGLPPHLQTEVSDLLALLRLAPGRNVLCGSPDSWAELPVEALQWRLQAMRNSRLAPRQQAYHALRDLTHAAFYSGPETWASLGYPGPVET